MPYSRYRKHHELWSSPHPDYNSSLKVNQAAIDRINSPDFTEQEYIDLVSGAHSYESDYSKSHAHYLMGTRKNQILDPKAPGDLEASSRLKSQLENPSDDLSSRIAHGILVNHKFNNRENNSKALAEIDRAANESLVGNNYENLPMYERDSRLYPLLKNGKLYKEDMARYFRHLPGPILNNKNLDPETFDYLISTLKPSEIQPIHVRHGLFIDTNARKILNSNGESPSMSTAVAMAEKGILHPRHAKQYLNWIDSSDSSETLDSLLRVLPESDRKKVLDDALGITGGSHVEERPESLESWSPESLKSKQAHWNSEVNWNNWKPGEKYRANGPWAKSSFLTDDQAEHVKRHGTFNEKMNLFSNPSVDPKHGAEMWEKWNNRDLHHGYDIGDWQAAIKNGMKGDNVISRGFHTRKIMEKADAAARKNYSLEDYINEHEGGTPYTSTTLDDFVRRNPFDFDTVGPNPDFDPSEESHPIDNPKYIDFADQNSGGGHGYNLSDHPDYKQILKDADHKMREVEGLPARVLSGYENRINHDEWVKFYSEAEKNYLDNIHKSWENLPPHLKGKIPGMAQEIMKSRLEDSSSALYDNKLEGPYTITDEASGSRRIDNVPTSHEYAPGLHHHQMVKDYADANDGKIDLGALVKAHPNLKDKFKEVLGDKQSITSQELQSKIDQMPKTKYAISMRSWKAEEPQNVNKRNQLVVRLDHSPESYKEFGDDPELLDTFKKIQESAELSGHPSNEDTIAWSRIDTSNPKHWMVDELQSDFSSALRRQIEEAKNESPETRVKLVNHLDKIVAAHKDWRENLMNFVISLAKKHGVEQISTHSPESKAAHTGEETVHTVYKDSYQKTPRQMGFKPVDGSTLPLTAYGQKGFSLDPSKKKTKLSAEQLAEIKRLNLNPHEIQQNLHEAAMNHHKVQAMIHSELAKIPARGEDEEALQNIRPFDLDISGYTPAAPEKHAELYEQHKALFADHKRAAMQHDPSNTRVQHAQFDQYVGRRINRADVETAIGAAQAEEAAPHDGDKLLSGSSSNLHSGHTLDLRPASFKKSDADIDVIGEAFAVKLMEIL